MGGDVDGDVDDVAASADEDAADRGDVAVVAAVRDRHVPLFGDEVVDRIEVDPPHAR